MPENLSWITGLALGGGLTLVGLVISFVVWRAKGAASGLRGVAWSLLPLAAGLIGLMNAVWQFIMSIFGILVGLLFNPAVWAGVALAGLAVVLYVVSGFMHARGVGAKPREKATKKPKPAREGGGSDAVAGAAGAGGGADGAAAGAKGQVGAAPKKSSSADDLSDLGDIEDLLRKRGIE